MLIEIPPQHLQSLLNLRLIDLLELNSSDMFMSPFQLYKAVSSINLLRAVNILITIIDRGNRITSQIKDIDKIVLRMFCR